MISLITESLLPEFDTNKLRFSCISSCTSAQHCNCWYFSNAINEESCQTCQVTKIILLQFQLHDDLASDKQKLYEHKVMTASDKFSCWGENGHLYTTGYLCNCFPNIWLITLNLFNCDRKDPLVQAINILKNITQVLHCDFLKSNLNHED